jgi:hypothetical protein
MNVDVQIGRLVLHGVDLRQRERAALPGAIRTELLNLLAESSGGSAVPPIPPASDLHARTPRVDAIARQIAASVHRGLPARAPGGRR